jgi:PadR family transcriptional regulator, regulatory protein PadR
MGSEPRMTLQTLKVLNVLLAHPLGEHYGLEICHAADLPGGTIYPILVRLEQAGWLTSAWEDINEATEGRRRRRFYQLTGTGAQRARQAIQEANQASQSEWVTFPDKSRRLGEAPA